MVSLIVGQKTTLTATLLNASPTAQVDTFVINGPIPVGHTYQFTLNGVVVAYTSQSGDGAGQVSAGLSIALTNAFPTNLPVNSGGGGTFFSAEIQLTAIVPGEVIIYTDIDPLLIHSVTPATGLVGSVDPGLIQWTTDDPTIVAITPSTIISTSPKVPDPIITGFFITIFAIGQGTTNVTVSYDNQGLIIQTVTQVVVSANASASISVTQGPVT